MTWINK